MSECDDSRTKRARGRPSIYLHETASTICDRLMAGESLRQICKDPRLPGRRTVFTWLRKKQDFRHQYSIARQIQTDDLTDEMLEIAGHKAKDYSERQGENDRALDGQRIERVWTQLRELNRVAARLTPKKYSFW